MPAETFRRKPTEVTALRFTTDIDRAELGTFLEGIEWRIDANGLVVRTLNGDVLCNPGDWVIRGIVGEAYPCDPDVFEKTYEPVA